MNEKSLIGIRDELLHVFPLDKIRKVNFLGELLYPSFIASLAAEILLFLIFAAETLAMGNLLGIALLLVMVPSVAFIVFHMAYDMYVIFRSKSFIPLSREGIHGYRPLVTIIIPVYDESPALLEKTLASVKRLDYPRYEILVTDESGREYAGKTARLCAREKVGFVHREKRGAGFNARALRLGVERAKGDLIGIIDADYRVDPSWLKKVVPYFAYKDIKVVNCPQAYTNTGNPVARVVGAFREQGKIKDLVRYIDSSLTSSATMILIDKATFREYFTGDYITEDFAFSIRMLLDGKLTFYVPDILGGGVGPTDINDYAKQQMRWLDNFRIFKDYFGKILRLPALKVVHLFYHSTQPMYIVPVINLLAVGLLAFAVAPVLALVAFWMYAIVEVQKFLFIKAQSEHLRFSDFPLFAYIGFRVYPYLLYEFANILTGGKVAFFRTPKE